MEHSILVEMYYREMLDFCMSVQTKFDIVAEHMDFLLRTEYDLTVPVTQNPYYTQLAGEYSMLDEPVYVKVEGSPIILTKEATKTYPWLLQWYREENLIALINQYPKQEILIRSILSSTQYSVEEIVAMDDLTIVRYDEQYLRSQEQNSLLEALHNYNEYFKHRWYIKDFQYEHLYTAGLLAQYTAGLLQTLSDKRFSNIKTYAVHDLHIWDYLDGHDLSRYRAVLTLEQQLFLYKNIDYITQRSGTIDVLHILTENILKDHLLNLVACDVTVVTDHADTDSTSHIPWITRRPIGKGLVLDDHNADMISTEEFYQGLIRDGLVDVDKIPQLPDEIRQFELSPSSVIDTKFLELERPLDFATQRRQLYYLIVGSLLYYSENDLLQYPLDLTDTINANDAVWLLRAMVDTNDTVPTNVPVFPTLRTTTVDSKYRDIARKYDPYLPVVIRDQEELLDKLLSITKLKQADELLAITGNEKLNRDIQTAHRRMFGMDNPTIRSKHAGVPYVELFRDNAELWNMYTRTLNNPSYTQELAETLLDKLLPFEQSDLNKTANLWDRSDIYRMLKELVEQLCSYNITFIPTREIETLTITDTHKDTTYDTGNYAVQSVEVIDYIKTSYDAVTPGVRITGELEIDLVEPHTEDVVLETIWEVSTLQGTETIRTPNLHVLDQTPRPNTSTTSFQTVSELIDPVVVHTNKFEQVYHFQDKSFYNPNNFLRYLPVDLASPYFEQDTYYWVRISSRSNFRLGKPWPGGIFMFNTGTIVPPTIELVELTKDEQGKYREFTLSQFELTYDHNDIQTGSRLIGTEDDTPNEPLLVYDTNWKSEEPFNELVVPLVQKLPPVEYVKLFYKGTIYDTVHGGWYPVKYGFIETPTILDYKYFQQLYLERPTVTYVSPVVDRFNKPNIIVPSVLSTSPIMRTGDAILSVAKVEIGRPSLFTQHNHQVPFFQTTAVNLVFDDNRTNSPSFQTSPPRISTDTVTMDFNLVASIWRLLESEVPSDREDTVIEFKDEEFIISRQQDYGEPEVVYPGFHRHEYYDIKADETRTVFDLKWLRLKYTGIHVRDSAWTDWFPIDIFPNQFLEIQSYEPITMVELEELPDEEIYMGKVLSTRFWEDTKDELTEAFYEIATDPGFTNIHATARREI